MKTLLALLLLIPSLSWGDVEKYLECQIQAGEITWFLEQIKQALEGDCITVLEVQNFILDITVKI